MEMTPEMIASEYRQAANKVKQIKILAELNLCAQRDIAEILREQGEALPGTWLEKLERPRRESAKVKKMRCEEDCGRQISAPTGGAAADVEKADTRDIAEAVARLLPDGESREETDGGAAAGGASSSPAEAVHRAVEGWETVRRAVEDTGPYKRGLLVPVPTMDGIRREACRLMAEARALGAEQYLIYTTGVLDLLTRIEQDLKEREANEN